MTAAGDEDGKAIFDFDVCLEVARRVDAKVRQQNEHGLFSFFEGGYDGADAAGEQQQRANVRGANRDFFCGGSCRCCLASLAHHRRLFSSFSFLCTEGN